MSSAPQTYVDEALYERLTEFAVTRSEDLGPGDASLHESAAAAVYHEARLLDDRRYRDWLARFDDECVYWVPIDPEADPRTKVSFMLDDRRRLEDRVALLETGWAHSQIPASQTCRTVSNVEAWPAAGGDVHVRCSVVTWEYRKERVRPFASRNDYLLSVLGDDWRIRHKIVALVDSAGDVPKFPFIL